MKFHLSYPSIACLRQARVRRVVDISNGDARLSRLGCDASVLPPPRPLNRCPRLPHGNGRLGRVHRVPRRATIVQRTRHVPRVHYQHVVPPWAQRRGVQRDGTLLPRRVPVRVSHTHGLAFGSTVCPGSTPSVARTYTIERVQGSDFTTDADLASQCQGRRQVSPYRQEGSNT